MSVQGEFYPELDERKTLNIKKTLSKTNISERAFYKI